MNNEEILKILNGSEDFSEVRNAGILPDPDGDEGYYFVSYAHSDYKKVVTDIIDFQSNGVKIWYDRGLESGKSWIKEVKNKISSFDCKGVIFYISDKYLSSQSCLAEISHAIEQNKPSMFIWLDTSIQTDNLNEITEFISAHPQCVYETAIGQKLNLLNSLPKPELFEYFAIDKQKILKIFTMRRLALVKKILDRNRQVVEIPPHTYINGKKYSVKGIAPNAFENCEYLEEVTIPDNWFTVMQKSFINCPSLRKVNLGTPRLIFGFKAGSLIDAFSGCENLSEINCPKGRLSLMGTFRNSQLLTEANFPENFVFEKACFKNCINLKSATLHKNDGLADELFANCIALEKVTIPENSICSEIGEDAFLNCKSLSEIYLPKSVRKINRSAFEGCTQLMNINLPEKTAYIDLTAFTGCQNLKTITSDAENYGFLTSILGKSTIDDIFPYAEKFYLKSAPKERIFNKDFTQTTSDKDGYLLFVKADNV